MTPREGRKRERGKAANGRDVVESQSLPSERLRGDFNDDLVAGIAPLLVPSPAPVAEPGRAQVPVRTWGPLRGLGPPPSDSVLPGWDWCVGPTLLCTPVIVNVCISRRVSGF